jgi:nitrate reductase NapE component
MVHNTLDQNNYEYRYKPHNYLIESILVTLFCCLPLGVVAIVHASQVDSKYFAKDFDGAEYASSQARFWMLFSFFSILVPMLLVGFVAVLGAILTGG